MCLFAYSTKKTTRSGSKEPSVNSFLMPAVPPPSLRLPSHRSSSFLGRLSCLGSTLDSILLTNAIRYAPRDTIYGAAALGGREAEAGGGGSGYIQIWRARKVRSKESRRHCPPQGINIIVHQKICGVHIFFFRLALSTTTSSLSLSLCSPYFFPICLMCAAWTDRPNG